MAAPRTSSEATAKQEEIGALITRLRAMRARPAARKIVADIDAAITLLEDYDEDLTNQLDMESYLDDEEEDDDDL